MGKRTDRFFSKIFEFYKNKVYIFHAQVNFHNGMQIMDRARIIREDGKDKLEFFNITIKTVEEDKKKRLSINFPERKFIRQLDKGHKFVQIIQGENNVWYYVEQRYLKKDESAEALKVQKVVNFSVVKAKENAERDKSFWIRNAGTLLELVLLLIISGVVVSVLLQFNKIAEAYEFGVTCHCACENVLPPL